MKNFTCDPWCLMSTGVYLSNVEAESIQKQLLRQAQALSLPTLHRTQQYDHLRFAASSSQNHESLPLKTIKKTCWIRLMSFSQPEKKTIHHFLFPLKKKSTWGTPRTDWPSTPRCTRIASQQHSWLSTTATDLNCYNGRPISPTFPRISALSSAIWPLQTCKGQNVTCWIMLLGSCSLSWHQDRVVMLHIAGVNAKLWPCTEPRAWAGMHGTSQKQVFKLGMCWLSLFREDCLLWILELLDQLTCLRIPDVHQSIAHDCWKDLCYFSWNKKWASLEKAGSLLITFAYSWHV